MKKYNTRPIDFTGCHPVIAEHLKRGEAIECRVWDIMDVRVGIVVGYSVSSRYPYLCDNAVISMYRHAEPIPIKTRRIMPPERAIPVLIAEGWRFNQFGQMENGFLPVVLPGAYQMMGCTLEDAEKYEMYWPPCIIEEVEDDE